MGGDAGVKSTNDVVENFLFVTHLVEEVRSLEAIFLVDKLPDVGAIVVGEGLYVLVDVKIFALVVGFILNMPDPSILVTSTLIGPKILTLSVGSNFLRVEP